MAPPAPPALSAGRLRAQIAAEHHRRDSSPDRIAELQRRHACARIEEFAAKVLAAAPPLREEQRQHLAAIMLGGDDETA